MTRSAPASFAWHAAGNPPNAARDPAASSPTAPSGAGQGGRGGGSLSLVRSCWQVLVVDDEPARHQMTRLSLAGTEILGRPLQLLHALSGETARQLLRDNPDLALVLLDLRTEGAEAGRLLVRFVRGQLGNRAMRIVLRGEAPAATPADRSGAGRGLFDCDIEPGLPHGAAGGGRLFGTVAAALRVYRDICALQRAQALLQTLASSNAPLLAAPDTPSFATEALRQLAEFAFFRAAAFIDVTEPDPVLPQASQPAGPFVIARLGLPAQPPGLDLPPLLLAHARVLPRLMVSEGDWHACCLRGPAGRRVVLVMRGLAVLTSAERHLLELFMRHVAIAFGDRVLELAVAPARQGAAAALAEAAEAVDAGAASSAGPLSPPEIEPPLRPGTLPGALGAP